jgi:4-amino-4-deoxy-L-arabinose transferase-like glycosyltransferase
VLAGKERPAVDKALLPKTKPASIISWVGLGLVLVMTLGWLLTFPTLQLLSAGLGGDTRIAEANRLPSAIASFFRSYPQILWLGFVAGAALFLGFRPKSETVEAAPTSETRLEIAGFSRVVPSWLNLVWRFAGIGALGLILLTATLVRIGDARNIGVTDLVSADYDESVYASSALLLTNGRALYRDFFSSQPPLGFLLWSLPQRLGGSATGGLLDFLRMRFFTSLLSLVTIALVYLTGRRLGGRWGGPLAGAIAALALTLDGGVIRIDQQVMLEPLVNLFTAAGLCAFVHIGLTPKTRLQKLVLPLLAGLFTGLALSVKLAALPLLGGLILTLLVWRRWKVLGWYLGGTALSFVLINGWFLLDARSEMLKQVFLYQLLRPSYRLAIFGEFYSESSLTAFDYLFQEPYLAFTLLAASFGLVAIVLRWVARRGGETWLPVVLVAALASYFYTGKAGFFPHYYAQMALPLALLAGGIINFWQPEWWRKGWSTALSVLGALVLTFLLWPSVRHAGDDPSKPVWSWERAAVRTFENLGLAKGSVFTLDTRFSFILGMPMPTDSFGKDWVENSAYTQYVGLGINKQSLGETLRTVFFDKKPDLKQLGDLRYASVVQDDLLKTMGKADYFISESAAESQLTPETSQALKRDFINREKTTRFQLLVNEQKQARYQSGLLFGDKMRLVAFNTEPELKLANGANGTNGTNKLPLKILWRGEDKIGEDYVIFIHLLNSAGQTVAQRDTAPRYGEFDTSKWMPGELLDDDQSVDLPANLPAGHYKIEMGVYRPTDGKRLKITNAPSGEIVSDDASSVILLEVNLVR